MNINGQQELEPLYGDNSQPALFKDNLSDSDNDSNGGGAALYLRDGQTLVQAAWFDGNMGSLTGVGQFNRGSVMYAERGAVVTLTADVTQACWRSGLCNLISNNNHVLIYAQRPETIVTIEDTEFTSNSSEFTGMIWLRNSCCLDQGDGPDLYFENNLVHHNESANAGLIKTDVSSELCCEITLDINGNTITDNQFNNEVFDINFNVKLNMHQNIVHEDAMIDVINLLDDPSTEAEISCLLVNNDEIIPVQATGVQLADPMFVDSESLDYHLLASSSAIDACDNTLFNPSRPDIDRQEKGNDIEDMIDINGPYDMGVDEFYLPDLIFSNNFE